MARKSYPQRKRVEQAWVALDLSGSAGTKLKTNNSNMALHPEGSTNSGGSPISFITAGDVSNGEYSCVAERPFTILATHIVGTIVHNPVAVLVGWVGLGVGAVMSKNATGVPISQHPRVGYNEAPGNFPAIFPAIDVGGSGDYQFPIEYSKGKRRVEIGEAIYASWSGVAGSDSAVRASLSFRVLCRLA